MMRKRLCFCFAAILATQAAAQTPTTDPGDQPIGPAGDVSKLIITGLDAPLAAQLRVALTRRLSLIRLEEPSTPTRTFLKAIGTAAQQALMAAGYPAPKVNAWHEKDTASLEITPGERYREGDVTIDAPPTVDIKALRDAFTAPTRPSPIHIEQTDDSVVLTFNGFDDLLKDATTADWIPGTPAPYDPEALQRVADTFRAAMHDQGFTQWDADANYEADKARHITALKIVIKSVGPKPKLAALTIHGAAANSDAVIRNFLHITADTTVDLPTVRKWFEALAASGRFNSQKLTLQTPDAGAQVTLDLTELAGVPPLDQPLSPVDQALLRVADWSGKLAESGDELVGSMQSPSSGFSGSFVFNARRGIAADMLYRGAPFTDRQPFGVSLVSDQGSFGFALNDQLHFFSPENIFQGRVDLVVAVLADEFKVGGAVDTNKVDVPRPLVLFHTLILPVGFLKFNHDPKYVSAIDNGVLTIRASSEIARMDAASGRFLDIAPLDPAATDAERFRSASGQLAAATDAFRKRTDPNLYDPSSPDVGLTAYITHSLLQSQLCVGTPEQRTRAAAAVDKILDRHLLADLLPPQPAATQPDDELSVPISAEERALTAQNPFAVVFASLIPQFYPYGSWPWTLCREFALPPNPASGELRRLYQDPALGPLACLAAAEIYSRSDPAIARNFAGLGLERLTAQAFTRDAAPLLSATAGQAAAARDALTQLRDLPDDDFQAILQTVPPPAGPPLIAVRRVLVKHRGQPIEQALPDLLDTIYPLLEPVVSAELHRLAAPPASPPAMNITP